MVISGLKVGTFVLVKVFPLGELPGQFCVCWLLLGFEAEFLGKFISSG